MNKEKRDAPILFTFHFSLFRKSLIQGFYFVLNLQFFVDVLNMLLDGFIADVKFGGNFLIQESFGEKVKNLFLAIGKYFYITIFLFLEGSYHAAGDFGTHW